MEREDLDEILAALKKVSTPPPDSDASERFGRLVSEAMERGREKQRMGGDAIQMPSRLSLAVIGLALTLIAGFGSGVTVWSNTRRDIEEIQQRWLKYAPRVDKLEEQISKLASVNEVRMNALDALIATKTNAIDAANKVQDERLTNLINRVADSSSGTNRSIEDMNKKLGQIGEDMASVRAKLSIDRPQAR